MTLEQAAPVVTPTPAPPPGQGLIQRITVEGTQRIRTGQCAFLPSAPGPGSNMTLPLPDRSLKVLFDT